MVKETVINTLLKLSKKFPDAEMLSLAVNEFGLFHGIVYRGKKNNWHFSHWDENEKLLFAYHYPEYENIPLTFACTLFEDKWECLLSFGKHFVWLQFDTNTGNITRIIPDDKDAEQFWITKHYKSRKAEIRSLIKNE